MMATARKNLKNAIPHPVPNFRAHRLAVQLEVALCFGNKDRFLQLCRRGIREFHRCRKVKPPEDPVEVYISAINPRIGGMLSRRARIETVADLALKSRVEILGIRGFGESYLKFCDELLVKHGLTWKLENQT